MPSILLRELCPSETNEVYEKLENNGISNVIDLLSYNPEDLARQTTVGYKVIENMFEAVYSCTASIMIRGDDLFLQFINSASFISTGFKSLDKLIGGLLQEELIEVTGSNDADNSNLVFNIAWNVAKNISKSVLFIGSVSSITSSTIKQHIEKNKQFSENVISKLKILAVNDIWKFLSLLNNIEHRNDDNLFLMVIDSFSALILPFLTPNQNQAFGLLNLISKNLKSTMTAKKMSIILVNNSNFTMAYDTRTEGKLSETYIGRFWNPVPNIRLLLTKRELDQETNETHVIKLVKSTRLKNSEVTLSLY